MDKAFQAAIQAAVTVLRRGGVILYPTDTVWGLGCDATNSSAVRRLEQIKERTPGHSMLVLLEHEVKLPYYVREVPDVAYDLIDAAVRPLTLIYPQARNLAPEIIAPDGTIGIRITHEAVSAALCAALKAPLVSTSANISGHPTPQSFAQTEEELKQRVDYIVPLRQEEPGGNTLPSEIIKIGAGGEVTLIRS